MRIFRMVAAMAIAASAFGFSAHAFTTDTDAATNSDGSAKFSDPDEAIPQIGEDGQPTSHFQAQPVDNAGLSYSLTPTTHAEPDAFQRAQENRQR